MRQKNALFTSMELALSPPGIQDLFLSVWSSLGGDLVGSMLPFGSHPSFGLRERNLRWEMLDVSVQRFPNTINEKIFTSFPDGKFPSQIIVIDKSERFTFKPLLYELLNNTATEDEVAPYFTQLLAPYPIRFIQSKVTEVEPDAALSSSPSAGGRVLLQDGASVEYDWLVLGLGSQTSTRSIPGVKELALPFNVYDDAVRVGAALQEIEDAAFMGGGASTIVIVGAGYAGVEMATVVAERVKGRARVQVVTPNADILDGCPEGQRLAAGRSLGALGVEVITGEIRLSEASMYLAIVSLRLDST